jgi:hypothetical protein
LYSIWIIISVIFIRAKLTSSEQCFSTAETEQSVGGRGEFWKITSLIDMGLTDYVSFIAGLSTAAVRILPCGCRLSA